MRAISPPIHTKQCFFPSLFPSFFPSLFPCLFPSLFPQPCPGSPQTSPTPLSPSAALFSQDLRRLPLCGRLRERHRRRGPHRSVLLLPPAPLRVFCSARNWARAGVCTCRLLAPRARRPLPSPRATSSHLLSLPHFSLPCHRHAPAPAAKLTEPPLLWTCPSAQAGARGRQPAGPVALRGVQVDRRLGPRSAGARGRARPRDAFLLSLPSAPRPLPSRAGQVLSGLAGPHPWPPARRPSGSSSPAPPPPPCASKPPGGPFIRAPPTCGRRGLAHPHTPRVCAPGRSDDDDDDSEAYFLLPPPHERSGRGRAGRPAASPGGGAGSGGGWGAGPVRPPPFFQCGGASLLCRSFFPPCLGGDFISPARAGVEPWG